MTKPTTRRSLVIIATGGVFTLMVGSLAGLAQTPKIVRIRGSVVSLDGATLVVKSSDGANLSVHLSDNVRISGLSKGSMADIKAGVFIGTIAVPQEDTQLRNLAVVVFPATVHGANDLPLELTANDLMGSIVKRVDGRVVTVAYKGGERRITIGPATTIVTVTPADKSEIKPGAMVLLAGQKQPDGILNAASVSISRDGGFWPM
jgi:hypothetical protein